MCGIAGYKGIDGRKYIPLFSRLLEHRGPDGEGTFFHKDTGLLNRRLAIIDRKGGDQPIYNEDGSIVIVYNGEIYNYRTLRDELVKLGHKFKTQSDTEVIVHGWEEWGSNCFARLNGMFALALYDKLNDKLILARDQFGIKPLFYAKTNEGIVFSSEIKPLLATNLFKKIPNDKVLYRYLAFRVHDDSRETFFDGIFRLLPGEMMIIDSQGLKTTRYIPEKWVFEGTKDDKTIEQFGKNLFEAIKLRLISEVPVGTSFSGGLDSSTVVAVVSKLIGEHIKESESVGKKQNTFSAVFPGKRNDEEQYINEVIKYVGQEKLSVHKVRPSANEFFTDLKDFIRTQEEPTISTGPYAQYQVMRKAKGNVTVLLDGQGSDEMMAGYVPYYIVFLKELLKSGKIIQLMKESIASRDILYSLLSEKITGLFNKKSLISPRSLLNNEFAEAFKLETFLPVSDNLKERLFEDVFKNSLQSLLRYEDRNTMRFSIEGRVPFLDLNLIKFIFSLPNSMIIRNGWNKYVLRKSITSLLPELVVTRRNKIGFTTPEYEWFLEKKKEIKEILSSESFKNRKYFDQDKVLKAWTEFENKNNVDTLLFWRLINVELWMREFID